MSAARVDTSTPRDPQVAVAAEQEAWESFSDVFGVAEDVEGALLYLTYLLDEHDLTGRQLRERLRLLDAVFRSSGREPPSRSAEMRRFLRGLHQVAPLGASRPRAVLYVEDVLGMLDALACPAGTQLQRQGFALLANATGLPLTALRALTWNDLRVRRDELRLRVGARPGQHGTRGVVVVRREEFPTTLSAIQQLRRAWGPGSGFVFGTEDTARGSEWAREATVGLASRGGTWTWAMTQPIPEEALASWLQELMRPSLRRLRDLALVSLSFAACLSAVEAMSLKVADVARVDRGLILMVPGRRKKTAVPFGRGRHCPVTYWERWKGVLDRGGRAPDMQAAFPGLRSGVASTRPLEGLGLIRVVSEAASLAQLPGQFGFTSLRIGFIRSAVRAGVPDVLILEQAGLETMTGLMLHTRRERLISHSVAGRVGL